MKISEKILNLFQGTKTRKNFTIYLGVGIFVAILNIIFMWLMIDIMHIPTIISSAVVIGFIFILKFFLYRLTGFTE